MTFESDPVLDVRAISKSFDGRRVLSEVSLSFQKGVVHGIIGPNGSGKSTFINVVTGFLPKEGGEIHLAGQDVANLPARLRFAKGMARTFQVPQIFESMTLRQHLRIGSFMSGGEWGFEIASLLGLDQRLDQPVGVYSHALRRLAEICHVAASQPKIVLLDEPAAGLSKGEVSQLTGAIDWLRHRSAICIVEHNMKFLLNLADRVSVFQEGRVIATGTPDEITENADVRKSYLGTDFCSHTP